MDKNQHIARLLESTKTSLIPTRRLVFWKRQQQQQQHKNPTSDQSSIAVCLHVHQITGLPPANNGQLVTVGWKITTRGSETEKTVPVQVCEGSAWFDEVFLQYCEGIEDARSVLKGIVLSVSMVNGGNLGEFKVDLSGVLLVENLNAKDGGKMVSLDFDGIANGGVLSVGVYCKMLEEEEACSGNGSSKTQSKSKCFSCLPDFKRLRIRPQTDSSRRLPSVRSTKIDNSIRKQSHSPQDNEEEGLEGFITIEKGVFLATTPRSHPPSDDLRNTDDDGDDGEEYSEDIEDDKKVEDEFLSMLEAKYWRKAAGKRVEGSLSYMSLDLDTLVKEAEMELNRAAQVWKRRVGGEFLEREEYEELMKKRWEYSNENIATTSSGCSKRGYYGFGSPFEI